MNHINPTYKLDHRLVVTAFKAMRRDGINTNVLTHELSLALLDVYARDCEPTVEIQTLISESKAAKVARQKKREGRKLRALKGSVEAAPQD